MDGCNKNNKKILVGAILLMIAKASIYGEGSGPSNAFANRIKMFNVQNKENVGPSPKAFVRNNPAVSSSLKERAKMFDNGHEIKTFRSNHGSVVNNRPINTQPNPRPNVTHYNTDNNRALVDERKKILKERAEDVIRKRAELLKIDENAEKPIYRNDERAKESVEIYAQNKVEEMTEAEKIAFLKALAEAAVPKSREFKDIRDKKLAKEKKRYEKEEKYLISQEPSIFALLGEKLSYIGNSKLNVPVYLANLTEAQKLENFPRPTISPNQYRSIILQETNLLSADEQKALRRDVESIFSLSLRIGESLRKIARDFHGKKAKVFESQNQPQMEKVFDELFEQIDAKVFAIRSEELGPYISGAKFDQIKLLVLRQQEAYLRSQYQVMEFLGSQLSVDDQAVLSVFNELSSYNRGNIHYTGSLSDLVEREFGYRVSECPDIMIDKNFVISINSIVNATKNKSINVARRIAKRRTDLADDLAFRELIENLGFWANATRNVNRKIINFCERISLPSVDSQLFDHQLHGHFIKMIDRFPFLDLFDMSRYSDVHTMAKGTLMRMTKEVLNAIKTFNQCEVPSNECNNFINGLKSLIEEIVLIPFASRKLQEKIADVRNFLINGE
ncbi:MAG: hypothetical protein LBH49_02460 [Puniceicoccales bacterium]|jgi:hypothetical protein|nr:hypothetical protein [Puniceicoccales bacterium]